jgi:hypothetical protein
LAKIAENCDYNIDPRYDRENEENDPAHGPSSSSSENSNQVTKLKEMADKINRLRLHMNIISNTDVP